MYLCYSQTTFDNTVVKKNAVIENKNCIHRTTFSFAKSFHIM